MCKPPVRGKIRNVRKETCRAGLKTFRLIPASPLLQLLLEKEDDVPHDVVGQRALSRLGVYLRVDLILRGGELVDATLHDDGNS